MGCWTEIGSAYLSMDNPFPRLFLELCSAQKPFFGPQYEQQRVLEGAQI
jgi:hypothetical protein